jgi:hypothetical protein
VSEVRGICSHDDCEKVSHRKSGPCYKHYHQEKGTTPNRGGVRLKNHPIDYDDFWLFVKKHVMWDGRGRPIGVKDGLNRDWKN